MTKYDDYFIHRYQLVSVNNKRKSATQNKRASEFLVTSSATPFKIHVVKPKLVESEDDVMDQSFTDTEMDDNTDHDYVPPNPKPKVKVVRSFNEEFLRKASTSTEVTAVSDK